MQRRHRRYSRNARNTQPSIPSISKYAELTRLRYVSKFMHEFRIPVVYQNFVDTTLPLLKVEYIEEITNRCIRTANARKFSFDTLLDDYKAGSESENTLIERFYDHPKLKAAVCKHVLEYIDKMIEELELTITSEDCQYYKRISEVQEIFNLSDIDVDILYFVYLLCMDNTVSSMCDLVENCTGTKRCIDSMQSVPNANFLTYMLPYQKHELAASFNRNAPFFKFKLVEGIDSLANELISFIGGFSDKAIQDTYVKECKEDILSLESLMVPPEETKIITTLMEQAKGKRSVNILFYGEPGTGKTEYARSLATHLKFKVLEVWTPLEDNNNKESAASFRFRSTIAADNIYRGTNSALIIDEADDLLNSRSGSMFGSSIDNNKKALINETLDNGKMCRIWITNHSNGIDPSTLRRFDYALQFEKLSLEQRISVWRTSVKKHNCDSVFTEDEITRLADRFSVNAGGIDVAMRNVKPCIENGFAPDNIIQLAEKLLESHEKTLGINTSKRKNSDANAEQYSLEGLNIQGGFDQPLSMLKGFDKYWKENAKEGLKVRNMNVLLYGPPGTGKTEFAKYIAREMKRKLIVKSATDLYNAYHGESEKRIKEAFRSAEREKSILLIDEADGLIRPREGTQNSWEIPIINEFLSNMESFTGILLCTTNFKKGLDSAAIRRFNIKLGFDFLTPEGILSFYKRVIESNVSKPLTDNDLNRLMQLRNIAPGDFKVVFQQTAFIAENKSHDLFINALENESRCKENVPKTGMGFRC